MSEKFTTTDTCKVSDPNYYKSLDFDSLKRWRYSLYVRKEAIIYTLKMIDSMFPPTQEDK